MEKQTSFWTFIFIKRWEVKIMNLFTPSEEVTRVTEIFAEFSTQGGNEASPRVRKQSKETPVLLSSADADTGH